MHAACPEVQEHYCHSNLRAALQAGSTQTEEGSKDGPRNSLCKRRNSTTDTTQLNKAIRPALVLSVGFTPLLF